MNEVLENLKMWSADPLCVAAAKQIDEWTAENERLRAALQRMKDSDGRFDTMYEIAQRALDDEQTADRRE